MLVHQLRGEIRSGIRGLHWGPTSHHGFLGPRGGMQDPIAGTVLGNTEEKAPYGSTW